MTDYIQMGIAYKKYHNRLIELAQKYFFLYFKTINLKGFAINNPTYLDEDELSIDEVDEDGEYASVKCTMTSYCYGEPQEDNYYVSFSAEEIGCSDVDAMVAEKVQKATITIIEKQKQERLRQEELKKAEERRIEAQKYQQYLDLKKQFESK